MLRLRLWNNSESSQFDIELYENLPVNLQYQFSDIQEVNRAVGSYSQTFRVPATKKNLNFFGGIIDPDVRETAGLINANYNVKRKIRAELSYNTSPLMQGTVQVKAIYRQKKDFHDIELIFFGEAVDLATSVGQSLLTDLDLSSLDYDMNYNNIISSYFSIGTFPLDGTIQHVLIDRGQNWDAVWDVNNPLQQSELTPMLQVKWLLNKILSTAGFTYDTSGSPFLDSATFDEMYMPLVNGSLVTRGDDEEDNGVKVGLGSNQTTSSTTTYSVAQMLDTVADGQDNGSNWDNTTWKWTAPGDMYFNYAMGASGNGCEIQLVKTTAVGSVETVLKAFQFGYIQELSMTYSPAWQIFVNTGDTVHLQFRTITSGTSTLYGNGTTTAATYLRIFNATHPVSGFTVDAGLNFPKFKQIDFLGGLQRMFNLVFIPDILDPKKLKIEPLKAYLESGGSKDWTGKIDFSKDMVIKPTTDIQKSTYKFTHSQGKDFVNESVFNQLGRVYGAKEILDPDNDYARGEQNIESGFASFILTVIPNNGVPVHRMINNQGAAISDPLPRIVYYNGLQSLGNTPSLGLYVMNDSQVPTNLWLYVQASSVDTIFPTVSSKDLNFGYEYPLSPHLAHPMHNLYYTYWSGYVNQLYSSSARILECSMYLTTEDLHSFQWNDKIYIESTYYRIISISGYDATTQAPCKVTLLKVLEDIADCVDIPTNAFNSTGIIIFNDSTTTSPEYGSKVCCEKYGYVWTPDKATGNGRCRPLGFGFTPNIV